LEFSDTSGRLKESADRSSLLNEDIPDAIPNEKKLIEVFDFPNQRPSMKNITTDIPPSPEIAAAKSR